MDPITFQVRHTTSSSTAGPPDSSDYEPMFALKIADYRTSGSASTNGADQIDTPIRRALSFLGYLTSEIDSADSVTQVIARLQSGSPLTIHNWWSCNTDFMTSTQYISGMKIAHYADDGTLYNDAEATWNGTGFNMYSHACNTPTNLSYGLPSQIGNVTYVALDGNQVTPASGKTLNDHVSINTSSSQYRNGGLNWSSDNGDYCFLGISDKAKGEPGSTDQYDTMFATNKGLAFGISDSDGAPSNSQVVMSGWSRRATTYVSGCTNWDEQSYTGHGGRTQTGIFIVYGIPI